MKSPGVNSIFMVRPGYISACLCLVLLSHFASGTYACEAPVILSPVPGAHVGTPYPNIAWSPVTGATAYEIDVVSRVPEGEVIGRQRTSTSATSFQPGQALAQDKAVVVTTLSAHCGDKRSAPIERRFDIDLAGLCPRPDGLKPVRMGVTLRLEWRKLPGAEEIEGRIFAGSGATPGERAASQSGPLLLPLPDGPHWVAGIRQRCRIGISDWVWVRESDLTTRESAAATSR